MSKTQKDRDYLSFLKKLGDIGSYTAAIVAYLLAITGRAPTPYPNTVSFLTVLVTVIAVWLWRLPRIKANSPVRTASSKTKSGKKDSSENGRNSLQLRNLEMTGLSFLSVAVLALGAFKFPSIQEEVTGLNCLNERSDFRVLVADFSAEENQFENNLANVLDLQSGQRFQICRLNENIQLTDVAQDRGLKHQAKLVIWGNNSQGSITIYFTALDWEVLTQHQSKLSASEGQEETAFLAETISAEILFNQGNTSEAQKLLYDALDVAEIQDWVQSNPGLLADGQFLLGLFYDHNYAPEDVADSKRAIEEYSNAIRTIVEWDLDKDGAYLNRALLYYDEGDFEKAIADYTVLVNKNIENINDVYFMRAQVYLDSGKCLDAIDDLETARKDSAIETDLLYPYHIHYLGQAYLLCGDLEAAEQVYLTMPELTQEELDAFSSDLNNLADNSGNSEMKEVIVKILNIIQ